MAIETIDPYLGRSKSDGMQPVGQSYTIEDLQPPRPTVYGEVRDKVRKRIADLVNADSHPAPVVEASDGVRRRITELITTDPDCMPLMSD